MRIAHLDFETRSTCDLKTAGAYVYGRHPTTEILILCWLVEDTKTGEAVRGRWLPGMPPVRQVVEADHWAAHNAAFEIAMWEGKLTPVHGWPPCPDVAEWTCTMELACVNGMPGALERAAPAAGLNVRKNMDGHRVMMKHCKPRKPRKGEDPDGVFWHEDPNERAILFDYCDEDVDVEIALGRRLPPANGLEIETMIVNRRINRRGVKIDRPAVRGAMRIAQDEIRRLNGIVKMHTNGRAKTTDQVQVILDWAKERGAPLDDLRAKTIKDALADEGVDPTAADELDAVDGSMDPAVREVLEARAEAAKASVKKLRAMDRAATPEDTIHEMFAYAGANRTMRFAGRRVQLHNMTRGTPPKNVPEEVWFDALATGDVEYFRSLLPSEWTVMDGLKVSIRGMIQARPGCVFLAADESQIEARVLPWLAGDGRKLEAFRRYDAAVQAGLPEAELKKLDIYSVTASDMGFDDRQAGKVGELGCGFGAGKRAIVPFAAGYGIQFSEDQADEFVQAWRNANALIVQFWGDEESAAKFAISHPGVSVPRGRTGSWFYDQARDALLRWLPSGRPLVYRRPRIEPHMTPWGAMVQQITYEGNVFAKGQPGVFVRIPTYGGKLAENITQAVARDVLCVGLCRAARAGLDAVMHVHDEQVVESRVEDVDRHRSLLVEAMTDPIRWLPDLPIASSCDVLHRYAKT